MWVKNPPKWIAKRNRRLRKAEKILWARKRSGRLRMVEKIPGDKGRVLALCACGKTKVVWQRNIRWGQAEYCSANCRQRFDIRHPHWRNQRMLSRRTGKVIRLGPPKWDPVTKKGVFSDGFIPAA
jgi:hypothetical protein